METPEGWERLFSAYEDGPADHDFIKAMNLLHEMAEVLKIYASGNFMQFPPQMDIKGPAIMVLRKWDEWK